MRTRSFLRGFGLLLGIAAPLIASAPAAAITLPSGLDVNWTVNGSTAPFGTATNTCAPGSGGPDVTQCVGNYTWSGATFTWDVSSDPDPFVNAVFGFTNNTAFVQTYVLTTTLPIAPPIPGGTLMGGSSQITINDSNGNGVATVASVGAGSSYTAQIDGVDVATLHGPAFSLSAPGAFLGNTANASFGLPGPSAPGPAALVSIGIRHHITLTPGDSVTLNSNFVVVVPEPVTGALLGLGVAGLAAFGSRRRA